MCIKHVDIINNVVWNIRNYRYVGDVSASPSLVLLVPSRQTITRIISGVTCHHNLDHTIVNICNECSDQNNGNDMSKQMNHKAKTFHEQYFKTSINKSCIRVNS